MIKHTTEYHTYEYDDSELEELLVKFAKEYPKKRFFRTISPSGLIYSRTYAVKTRELVVNDSHISDLEYKLGPVQLEELRGEIRGADIFVLQSIKAIPSNTINPDTFNWNPGKFMVRFATITYED